MGKVNVPKEMPQGMPESLEREIHMLRAVMRRVKSLADDDLTLPELLRVLDTLSSASMRLARLLKAEQTLCHGGDAAAALQRALAEVIAELGEGSGR